MDTTTYKVINVLIFEPDQVIRNTLSIGLSSAGYYVDSFSDGKMAIYHLSESAFDLIIMDLHLTYFSGIEIIQYLRNKVHSHIPVIAIGNNITDEEWRLLKKYQVEAFFAKPVDPLEILEKVDQLKTQEHACLDG